MMQRLAVLCLFVFLPLAACTSTQQPLGPGVTQAQADLNEAEKRMIPIVRALITARDTGLLKGKALEDAQKAVSAEHALIKSAREAVDAGRANGADLAARALSEALRLALLYLPQEKRG